MQPYSPGKPIGEVQRELGIDSIIKLASNENPLGPPPLAIAAVKKAAEEMHHYPDATGYELRVAISKKFNMPLDQVAIGAGSDELIHLLGQIFLGDVSDELLTGDPSFVRYYAAAHLAPCKLVRVPLDAELRFDLRAMAKAVNENTKLIFIANPNNPTGTIVRRRELLNFIDDVPPHVPIVLDEAYYEFAAIDKEFPNSLELIRDGRLVIALRTFSKTYGLAGARIGYMFAHPEVIDAMDRAREPFNVNNLAQAAALAALDDDDHLQKTVANNQRELSRMNDAFRSVGARPIESFANFVLADMGRPARPIFEELLKRGVIVRSGEVLGMPNFLRVSVGTESEITRFIEALRETVAVV